jgi:hypothetical protein
MRYGEYEDAKPIVEDVQAALRQYRTSIGGAKAKVDVMRAVRARKADGSILEYGLDYHVKDFTDKVMLPWLPISNIFFVVKEWNTY